MKKVLTLCLVAVLAIGAIVGGTMAYFTDDDQAVNTFTFGNVDIEIEESDWDPPTPKNPGVAYDKTPVVKNVGDTNAWIKVDVVLSDADVLTAAAAKYDIKDLTTIFGIAQDFDQKWELASAPVYDETAKTLTYSYYYLEMVEAEDETDELFSTVTIPAQFTYEDVQGLKSFNITIKAYAVQEADAFTTVQGAFASIA